MKDNLLKQRIITSILITFSVVLTTKPSYGKEINVNIHNLCSKFPLSFHCQDYKTSFFQTNSLGNLTVVVR